MTLPGISVTSIIEGMPRRLLARLAGEDLVSTLATLTPGEVSDAELRRAVSALYGEGNPEVVLNERLRSVLLEALPIKKAHELVSRLQLKASKGSVYELLDSLNYSDEPVRSKTLEFFGVIEQPTAPPINVPSTVRVQVSYGLFEHQREAALRVERALSEAPRKVLLHMPTGAGKTRTSMHIVSRHLLSHRSTLVCWFANTKELLEQAASEMEQCWKYLGDRELPVYRFWGDKRLDLREVREGVLVTSYAKLNGAFQRDQQKVISVGDRATLTVVDEAHQAIAPTYRAMIDLISKKQPNNALLGLSATPGRTWNDVSADEKLADYFDNMKVTLEVEGYADPVSYLISEGYLARPKFRSISFDGEHDLSSTEKRRLDGGDDLSEEGLSLVGNNGSRNGLIVGTLEELLTRHTRVIVFAASVNHARLLAGILVARGTDAKVVTGETPASQRDRMIRQFKARSVRPMVLCNFGVLTTGFDAPQTSAALIARPTKSLVLYSQMVGRAIRGPRAGGNTDAEVVTVIDTRLPGFGDVAEAFTNWEDVWNERY